DDGEVGAQRLLEDVPATVDLADLLALGDRSAVAGGGVKAADAGPGGANSLGQGALRHEGDLELAGQVEPLEGLVLADVGGGDAADLTGGEQQAEPGVVDAAVVEIGRASCRERGEISGRAGA